MKTDNMLGAEYLAAVAAERSAWRRLQEPATSPGHGAQAYHQWLAAAHRTKALALKLRDARADAGPSARAALAALRHAECRPR